MYDRTQSLGALPSPKDLRTFSFLGGEYVVQKGGRRYLPDDIEDQSLVGICTAISLTQNARKAYGGSDLPAQAGWSADFLYLLQKKYFDKNWNEGSSIFHAIKTAYNYGFLPANEWRHTTQEDRALGYAHYINKLKAVPQVEIDRLLTIASGYKLISAYASVPVDRNSLARAIEESRAGILVRFNVGKEWWTNRAGTPSWNPADIQPLRKPQVIVSGHAVTESNFDGGSFRIANTWGKEWADGGTAYHALTYYAPTEAFAVIYSNNEIPIEIQKQIEERNSIYGQILDHLQKIIVLVQKLRNFFPS